jgi:hypothetical protein
MKGGKKYFSPGLAEKQGLFSCRKINPKEVNHMAKDTPNTPDGEEVTPAEENLQAAPGGEPLAADSPAPGEVVVTAEKIAELDEERRRAAREAGASGEQTAPKGRRGRPPRDKGGEAQEAGQSEPGEQAAEGKEPEAPAKKGRGGRPPKADKAENPGNEEKAEKPPKATLLFCAQNEEAGEKRKREK